MIMVGVMMELVVMSGFQGLLGFRGVWYARCSMRLCDVLTLGGRVFVSDKIRTNERRAFYHDGVVPDVGQVTKR